MVDAHHHLWDRQSGRYLAPEFSHDIETSGGWHRRQSLHSLPPRRNGRCQTLPQRRWQTPPHRRALMPDLPMVDAHHHLWDRQSGRYLAPEFSHDIETLHSLPPRRNGRCQTLPQRRWQTPPHRRV
jgi:hypothetical protein